MILNNADNIMLGNSEVSKAYCGSTLVWEKGNVIPEEVQAQIEYAKEHFLPDVPISDIGYIYGTQYNSNNEPYYATLILYPMSIVPELNNGFYSTPYVTLYNDESFRTRVWNNSATEDMGYLWNIVTPSGNIGTQDNPLQLYGNFPNVTIYDHSWTFYANYTQV